MKVAILGYGFMGKIHANAFKQMDDVNLVGIVTGSKKSKDAFIDGCAKYDSFEKLIEEQTPDVISICLPTYLHKEYVIKAAKLGIHVICEKPIALNEEDAKEMISVCERNNVRLFIGHVLRFFPEYKQIKDSIDKGSVGNIGVLHARRANLHPGTTSSWYHDESKSGGVILDLIIHDIDFMRYINGEVSSVYAQSKKRDNIDMAYITLQFKNDAIGNIEALWATGIDLEYSLEVYGSKGIVHLTNQQKPIQIKKVNEPYYKLSTESDLAYYDQLKHFIKCILTGNEAIITPDDACEALKIALAASKSIQTGLPVEV